MKQLEKSMDEMSDTSSVQEGKNIKVYLRVRPANLIDFERGSHCILNVIPPQHAIIETPRSKNQIRESDEFPWEIPSLEFETNHEGPDSGRQHSDRQQLIFGFDGVFEQRSTQIEVFNELGSPIVQSALDGYNSCCIAYGQTGSGKTYSMMGKEGSLSPFLAMSQQQKAKDAYNPDGLIGLIPRACVMLFESLNDLVQSEGNLVRSYRVELSCVEIYNEVVKCLLDDQAHCVIREDPLRGPIVHGALICCIDSAETALNLIDKAFRRRTSASTGLNKVSSRSHAICTFNISITRVKSASLSEPYTTSGAMHFVDLAGSERAYHAKTEGERLREGAAIGKSLLSLGQVIKALVEDKPHVPYRESQLTWLLKSAIGGNSRTVMLTTVSPNSVNYHETLSALSYADRVKSIRNRPQINKTRAQLDFMSLQREVEMLKEENFCLKNAQMKISSPADSKALLLQRQPLPLQGAPIGHFLCKGTQTIIKISDRFHPENIEESSAEVNQIVADWTGTEIQLIIPANFSALISYCTGRREKEIGALGAEYVFDGDTIVLVRQNPVSLNNNLTTKTKAIFYLIGGTERSDSSGIHDQKLQNCYSPSHFVSHISSPENSVLHECSGRKSHALDSEVINSLRLEITSDAINELLKSVNISPENDLPHFFEQSKLGTPEYLLERESAQEEWSKRKTNSPNKISKLHVKKDESSFELAFDSFHKEICVILEKGCQSQRNVTDNENTPLREGTDNHRTIIHNVEDIFPYVVLYVSAFLARNSNNLDKKLCDIIEETARIHKNYQNELEVKSMNETELLELIKTGANELIDSQKSIEDLTVRIQQADNELLALRADINEKAAMLTDAQRQIKMLTIDFEDIASLKSLLEKANMQINQNTKNFLSAQSKCADLESEIKSLQNESVDDIHKAISLLSSPLQVSLPEEINLNCPLCEKLCIEIADLNAKLQVSEKYQYHLKSKIEEKTRPIEELISLKNEIREVNQNFEALKLDQNIVMVKLSKCEAENKRLRDDTQSMTQMDSLDGPICCSGTVVEAQRHQINSMSQTSSEIHPVNTDLFKQVDMIDDRQFMIQKLAHDLEEKSKVLPNKEKTQHEETKTQENAPQRTMDLVPSSGRTLTSESKDLDRYIMEVKKRVDHDIENTNQAPLRGEAARMLDVIREELLNSPTIQSNAFENYFPNPSR